MSHPSGAEQQRLAMIAGEVREQLEERGYRVGVAVDLDRSFTRSRRPGSSLMRELVAEGAARGARKSGMFPESVSGGGLDIVAQDGNTFRRYRLKQGTKLPDGSYKLIVNSDSVLSHPSDDLFCEESWVLGYILTDNFQVVEIFAGEILGVEDRKPGRLILGEVLSLSAGSARPPRGFTSTDEGLEGFGDEEDGTGEDGLGAV